MRGLNSLRLRGLFLTFIAASSWPLHIVTVNLFMIVRPERVFGIVVVTWVLGMLLVAVLVASGLGVKTAENTSFAATLLAVNGGPILLELGVVGGLAIAAVVALTGVISARMSNHWLIEALVWGVAIFVITGPVLTFFESWSGRGGPSVVNAAEGPAVDLVTRPDIFVIVLDGYPGSIAAELDGLDSGAVDFDSELDALGFEVPESSWSAYWTTTLSIPSLMEMKYVVDDSGWRDLESQLELQQILAGDSAVIETVRENGYRTHMIETGWSASKCGPQIDECVPAPLIDEATHLILDRTIARPVFDGHPGPYVAGVLSGFEWLLENAEELSRSSTPDFTFMHVVSPHPPLLLRPDCSFEVTLARIGMRLSTSHVPASERDRYLVEQMDCLERRLIELAKVIDTDDVVIVASDHGTDRRGQSEPDVVNWGYDSIVERMNNFVAIRAPAECRLGREVVLPNVFRVVMGCLGTSPIELLPERMWINPMIELEEDLVTDLLDLRPSG